MQLLFMSPVIFVNMRYGKIKIFLDNSNSWINDSRDWAMRLGYPNFDPMGVSRAQRLKIETFKNIVIL